MAGRADRIATIIAGVLRQAIADSGAERVILLADGSPEAELLTAMLQPRLGGGFATREAAGPRWPELLDAWANAAHEQPGALVAAASNKTAALLGAALPGPLLPLGDVWASQVQALCGAWSGPPELRQLSNRAGSIESLDAALATVVDRRRMPHEAGALLAPDVAGTLLALWERGRFARRHLGLVPKLGQRTIGVDLFD